MTRRATFTEADLKRAIKVAKETGFDTVEMEIDGKIVRLTNATRPEPSGWDQRFGSETD